MCSSQAAHSSAINPIIYTGKGVICEIKSELRFTRVELIMRAGWHPSWCTAVWLVIKAEVKIITVCTYVCVYNWWMWQRALSPAIICVERLMQLIILIAFVAVVKGIFYDIFMTIMDFKILVLFNIHIFSLFLSCNLLSHYLFQVFWLLFAGQLSSFFNRLDDVYIGTTFCFEPAPKMTLTNPKTLQFNYKTFAFYRHLVFT